MIRVWLISGAMDARTCRVTLLAPPARQGSSEHERFVYVSCWASCKGAHDSFWAWKRAHGGVRFSRHRHCREDARGDTAVLAEGEGEGARDRRVAHAGKQLVRLEPDNNSNILVCHGVVVSVKYYIQKP